MSTLLLYTLPLIARFGITGVDEPIRIVLSLLPLLVVLPTLRFQAWFSDERREHVARHGAYAMAFTVSALTSVRWEVVYDRRGQAWAQALIGYLAVGSITLWWFCLSHMAENRLDDSIRTHQGDVAVLPLTLFAIATFASQVPYEAFQFSRSIIFFVPVVVAWATLHFIAFSDFASRQVTTYKEENFDILAHSGLVVASALLTMLELNASSFLFQLLPLVSAVLCQLSVLTPPLVATIASKGRVAALLGIVLAFPAAWVWTLKEPSLYWTHVGLLLVAHTVCITSFPRLVGPRWVVPATLYSPLLTIAYVTTSTQWSVTPFDAVALTCLFYVTFLLIERCSPLVVPQF